ncbi:MAG: hypothetical protein IT539_07980 [Bradyrhizobiaceae bacterium]|nr:hypothetical protein [Bradyrhizobiaceae bacterium]
MPSRRDLLALLSAVLLLAAGGRALAQGAPAAAEAYARARGAYEREAEAYWNAVGEKRQRRAAKRREKIPATLDDYVLMQPPVYSGPPAPPMPDKPRPARPPMPVIADFLRAAEQEFDFLPDLGSEAEFKRAYARAALAAGLTREQVVGVYVFETGGNGRYDTQAGVTRPGAPAISPAVGYNQLLSTNTVGLLAEYGDEYLAAVKRRVAESGGPARQLAERKFAALARMVKMAKSLPFKWSEHDEFAKNTLAGWGMHAAILDIDVGPLLQVRKLVNSVNYARRHGYTRTLTAAELELMNFTGDGNGIDLVSMPPALRARVPTANFFQREGYERNPIARRTGTVSALFASIEGRMERADAAGVHELAAAFDAAARAREADAGRLR